jgi:hypothetical protein
MISRNYRHVDLGDVRLTDRPKYRIHDAAVVGGVHTILRSLYGRDTAPPVAKISQTCLALTFPRLSRFHVTFILCPIIAKAHAVQVYADMASRIVPKLRRLFIVTSRRDGCAALVT